VADYFSISKPTVYRLIADGEIQAIKIRQCVRVSAQEIKRLEKYFKFDVFE
jgi:excisionase family DNA binding protein